MAVDIEGYIRKAAIARGIDPDIAVRVARGEGGLSNPFRHGEGPAPRSQLSSYGKLENSYGPFQLYISGTDAGLGDRALAAGIDPRNNWQGGVDFALDEVNRKGWGQWYGAKAAGITGMEGVSKPGLTLGTNPARFSREAIDAGKAIASKVGDIAASGRGTGASAATISSPLWSGRINQAMQQTQAAMDAAKAVADAGKAGSAMASAATSAAVPTASPVAGLFGALSGIVGAMGGGGGGDSGPTPITPSSLGSYEAADAQRSSAASTIMQSLLQKRKKVPGLNLGMAA